MMAAVSTTGAKSRAGLVSRHHIEVIPQDPVQSLDWPNHLEGAGLVQSICDWRSHLAWSYLALPPDQRRENAPTVAPC
jgi:hypothetical protein